MNDAHSSAVSGTVPSGEFGAPVAIDNGDSQPPPPPKPTTKAQASKATAATCAELLDLGLALGTGLPLMPDERKDFTRDLAAVLRKYDVPDIPYAEEVALAGTCIRIIVPRVLHRRGIGAPTPDEVDEDDSALFGQERQRQDGAAAQAGLPPLEVGSEAAGALS